MAGINELVFLVSMVTGIFGCSIPEGGYTVPTPAELVSYATHVLVGEVTARGPDPMFGDNYLDSTYGANVTVQCIYKGGPIPGDLSIGGAGFIPGRCEAMDLAMGSKYVMFLDEVRNDNGQVYYQQNSPAYPLANISSFLNLCGLKVSYPQQGVVTLKRKMCPPTSTLSTCIRYTHEGGEVTVQRQDVSTVKAMNNNEAPKNQANDPAKTDKSTDGDGGNGGGSVVYNMASSLVTGLGLALFVLL